MNCCKCGTQDPSVHLTQIENPSLAYTRRLVKIDLCERCAKELGVNDPEGFSLADLLLGLGQPLDLPKP